MDYGESREQLEALRAIKARLQKKIAGIGGPASMKLSVQLDEVDEEMSEIEIRMERERSSRVHSQESISDRIEDGAR